MPIRERTKGNKRLPLGVEDGIEIRLRASKGLTRSLLPKELPPGHSVERVVQEGPSHGIGSACLDAPGNDKCRRLAVVLGWRLRLRGDRHARTWRRRSRGQG